MCACVRACVRVSACECVRYLLSSQGVSHGGNVKVEQPLLVLCASGNKKKQYARESEQLLTDSRQNRRTKQSNSY